MNLGLECSEPKAGVGSDRGNPRATGMAQRWIGAGDLGVGSGCHFCSSVYGISSLVADYYLAYTGRTLVLFCFSQENLKVDFLNNDLCALSPIQVYLGVD